LAAHVFQIVDQIVNRLTKTFVRDFGLFQSLVANLPQYDAADAALISIRLNEITTVKGS
jgi:hypothetical protein